MIPLRQPAIRRRPHRLRRCRRIGRKLAGIIARIAGIKSSLGQRDALAAKAAHLLQPANRARCRPHGNARHIVGVRPRPQPAGQQRIDARLHRRRIHARPHIHHQIGNAALLQRQGPAGNRNRQPLIAHQRLMQQRCSAAGKRCQRNRKIHRIGVILPRNGPAAHQPRGSHLVAYHRPRGRFAPGNRCRKPRRSRPGRNLAKGRLHHRPRGRGIDIPGQHQHRVVRPIVGGKPRPRVGQRCLFQILHPADTRSAVGVIGRIQPGQQRRKQHPIGLVFALLLLVEHHAPLRIQLVLRQRRQQPAHAIGFQKQRQRQRRGRHGLEIIGAVKARGAVEVGRPDRLQRLEMLLLVVLRAIEHQMLEQMRIAGLPHRLVLRSHMIPHAHRNQRRLAIGVHHHAQPVGQRELLIGDVHLAHEFGQWRRRQGRPLRCQRQRHSQQNRGGKPRNHFHHQMLLTTTSLTSRDSPGVLRIATS